MNEKDKIIWKGGSHGRYIVKANVNLLGGVSNRQVIGGLVLYKMYTPFRTSARVTSSNIMKL